MQEHLDRVLHDFLLESQENLGRVEQEFVRLEQDPGDPELLGDIFRTIHSIKGSAGFLGLTRLEEVAHAAEDVLGQLRGGTLALNERMMNCLLHAIDSVCSILMTLERTGEEGEHETQPVIAALHRISEGKDCGDLPRHARANTPSASPGDQIVEAVTGHGQEHPERENLPLESGTLPSESSDSGLTDNENVMEPHCADPLEHALASVEETRMHVDISVLDRLMNLTGELVLSRNHVVRLAADSGQVGWLNAAQRLDGIVSELQEEMLKTRMQELRKVFSLFPRLVRDVSKQHGKDVTLHIEGQQTELDRSLIEGLKMPLMHLVRNAIDHGIEMPKTRRTQGKPSAGTITITAYHDSGQVNISIADDGAGIDMERVTRKAVEQGILTQDHAEYINSESLLDLIFRPGFSTSDTITNLSGRGVGMDVVKRHLNRLGGVIEIATEPGRGTTFTIRIPMTLAIIPGLLVMAGERHFVIPQRNLEELVRLDKEKREAITRISGTEVYRLRGELLPLLRLNRVLDGLEEGGSGSPETAAMTRSPHIIVLSSGDRRFGVIVDHVTDTEEIVVKPLGRHLKEVACYDGATILGDGNVALILNARGLLAAGRFRLEEIQRAEQKTTDQQQRAAILSSQEHRQTIVLFKAGHEEFYGVPLAFVERIETCPSGQISTSGGREVMQYRGDVLPLIRLEPLLNLAPPPDRDTFSLLVFSVEKDIGLVVQEVINTVEISVRIDTKSFQQKGVLGASIVEGYSVLILDIHGLIELAYPLWYQQFFVSKLHEAERQKIRVLLVEDSKFFMNIEKSYLESAGYQVVTAEHGNAAQERLAEQPIDVVITDIDMPYCNGYELTRAIRAHREWKQIPVMAVTALSSDEDRQKGIEAGVDDYRVKLARDDVLSALEQLILRTLKEK